MPTAPGLTGLIAEGGDFESWLRQDTLRHLKASEYLERELLECSRLQAERFFLKELQASPNRPDSKSASLPAGSD